MERPDSLLSVVTGWLAAAALGAKVLFDWIASRAAARKASAETIKAETDAAETLFARAERTLKQQDGRITELEKEVAEQRVELRRLVAVEDRAIRDALAHEREAAAWKERESELLAQIERLRKAQG